jgi:hypothetical protein
MPASATYHAKNAARSPNMPPASCNPLFGAPPVIFGVRIYASASIRKASQSQKKRRQKTTVERRVRIQSRNVKMNQP